MSKQDITASKSRLMARISQYHLSIASTSDPGDRAV